MTPFWSHSFAMRSRGAAFTPDPWFSQGNLDINHYFGADATEVLRPGDSPSGNVVGTVASKVLSPVTTPTFQQPLTGTAGDPLGVLYDRTTTDSHDAALAADFNVGTTAFCWVHTARANSPNGNQDTWFGNFDSTSGYAIYTTTSGTALIAVFRGPGGIRTFTLQNPYNPADTAAHYFMYGASYVDDRFKAMSDLTGDVDLSALAGPSFTGSLDSASPFSMGSVGGRAAGGHTVGPSAFFIGAAAEYVIANRATLLPAWWTEATS